MGNNPGRTFELLWAPWRMEYIRKSKKKESQCLFCKILREGSKSARKNLVLSFQKGAFIMLNRYPYSNGHLMIVSKKHKSKLGDFTKNELAEIMSAVKESEIALMNCFKCEGFNIGINIGKVAGAGIADHLHVHIVPRWKGDTNYMTVTGSVRVIPQSLDETYKSLEKYFIKKEKA